jgi:chromosome segregation ATPase
MKLHDLLDKQVRHIRECTARLEQLLETRRTRLDRFEQGLEELRDDFEQFKTELTCVDP